jgi:hypothetical protein
MTAHSTPKLGEYIEFVEPWWQSLAPIATWLLLAALLGYASLTARADVYCDSYKWIGCRTETPADGARIAALGCLLAAAFLTGRLALRRPSLRIGELGFEIRTQMFLSQFVPWAAVSTLGQPRNERLLWTFIGVTLVPIPEAPNLPAWVRVRLSGLSAPIADVEQALLDGMRRSRRHRHHPDAQPEAILPGVEADTGDGEHETEVTDRGLLAMLRTLNRRRPFVVLTRPGHLDPDGFYIQAALGGAGGWHLECRDGGPDQHFGAECDSVEQACDTMLRWCAGGDAWRTALDWSEMDVETERPPRPAEIEAQLRMPVEADVEIGDGRTFHRPTERRLLEMIQRLGGSGDYVRLTVPERGEPDLRYIEVTRSDAGDWKIEHRDGAFGHHFELECDGAEAVLDLLVQWAADTGEWQSAVPWDRVRD